MKKFHNKVNHIKKQYAQLSMADGANITCMGLYNHGKSTLLNVLVGDMNFKTFKTADIRETQRNKRVVCKALNFVDTPGLNVRSSDNVKVIEAVRESDINLFVHNISSGELNKIELDSLRQIQQYWESDDIFLQRTLFVLSQCDKLGGKEIEVTEDKVMQQITGVFSTGDVQVMVVSALRYSNARQTNKKQLIKRSGIDDLMERIKKLYREHTESILETRKYRLSVHRDELFDEVYNALKSTQKKLAEKSALHQQMTNDIEQANKRFAQLHNELKLLE